MLRGQVMPHSMKPSVFQPGALPCSVVVPGSGAGAIRAVAHSLDRHGAVVSLDTMPDGGAIDTSRGSRVELEVRGASLPDQTGRSIHCLARVVRSSKTSGGMVWLVLQFDQVQFRDPGENPGNAVVPLVTKGNSGGRNRPKH